MSKTDTTYRRSPFVVCYWLDDALVFENYVVRRRITADPFTCTVLDFFQSGKTLRQLFTRFAEYNAASLQRSVNSLVANAMLEPCGRQRSAADKAHVAWGQWNPAAGFFHFSTKDFKFEAGSNESFASLRRLARAAPKPEPTKHYRGVKKIPLHWPKTGSAFSQVLMARRTWRKFSRRPVDLHALGALLGLTWGVQGWVHVPDVGSMTVKTSPSGGCLHPIEAYVLATNVGGLRPGVYHYDGAGHRLDLVSSTRPGRIANYLEGQSWFGGAAFVVFMTAVFGRSQWKYDYARAYRAILLEAGHLCQTFCLAATSLNLAPFCTIAFADSKIEKILGIDGISESVVYAAGAGVRPENEKDAHLWSEGRRKSRNRQSRGVP